MPSEASITLDLLIPDRAELGDQILHYRLGPLIGEGGMGCVFEAFDQRLERSVAVKVLKPALSKRPAARANFLREARALAAIRHPNVVTIFAVEDAKLPFMVMERLEGRSLMTWLEHDQSLTVAQVVGIGQQVASGLAAAHAACVLHRDIKPHNIFLENGVAKLLDFGLSVALQHEPRAAAVAGTPYYMAPEQIQAEPVDERTDLYALGVVLYRLLSGRFPFGELPATAALVAVTTRDAPTLATHTPSVPSSLIQLVDQLIARNPDHRLQSASEVVQRLEAIDSEVRRGWIGRGLRLLQSPQLWLTLAASLIPLLGGALAVSIALPSRVIGQPMAVNSSAASSLDSLPAMQALQQELLPSQRRALPLGRTQRLRNLASFDIAAVDQGRLDMVTIEVSNDESASTPLTSSANESELELFLIANWIEGASWDEISSIPPDARSLSEIPEAIPLGKLELYDEQLAGNSLSPTLPAEALVEHIRQRGLPCSIVIASDSNPLGTELFATLKLRLTWYVAKESQDTSATQDRRSAQEAGDE